MNVIYIASLGVGGTLLLASLFLGGDSEADVDADGDAELDIDGDGLLGWLPFGSVRFWVFFTAFFGLTGAALIVVMGKDQPAVQLPIALGLGYFSGLAAVKVIKALSKNSVGHTLTPNDFLGEEVNVTSAIAEGKLGRVSLEIKGQVVELIARTEDQQEFASGTRVVLYEIDKAGHAVVTAKGNGE